MKRKASPPDDRIPPDESHTPNQVQKCGFVAVLGAPNAGKSTLVNYLVGAKVSIVTHKVQTTRTRITGVCILNDTQIVYVDTPGIFSPRKKLDRAMVSAAWEGADGADLCLVMIDAPAYHAHLTNKAGGAARRSAEDTGLILNGLKQQRARAVLVLNKIDDLNAQALLPLTENLTATGLFGETFMISARRGYGMAQLQEYICEKMPKGPWMYPEDQLSDISDRLMAAEITREKLFLRLHQEVPYSLTVETERWERTKKGDIRLEQTIYVERDSQKALVLGQKGRTVKAIGEAARSELTALYGIPVHLFLFVKVREKWSDTPARYREMGLTMVD